MRIMRPGPVAACLAAALALPAAAGGIAGGAAPPGLPEGAAAFYAGLGLQPGEGADVCGEPAAGPETGGERLAAAGHRMPAHLRIAPAGAVPGAEKDGPLPYSRRTAAYDPPGAMLRDRTGRGRALAEVLDHDGPLLLNFIFTSCATICPVMSATFGEAQETLAAIEPGYRMVSVSIDPEYDTPARLREYAALHGAREGWVFLTGDLDRVLSVVRAFDAVYRSDNKMYHLPLTFLRPRPGAEWVRLEGLLSVADLAGEYSRLVAAGAR